MTGSDEVTTTIREWLAEPVSLPTAEGIEQVARRVRRTHQRHRWRSIVRWPRLLIPVTAIAIVTAALVGSVLLIGASSTQTLTTVVVEPGVERIVSDGIRDLSIVGEERHRELAIGLDGSVWLFTSPPSSNPVSIEPTLIRLGDPSTYAEGLGCEGTCYPRLKVGPDGAPWSGGYGDIRRHDGNAWSLMGRAWKPYDIGPDGTIWAGWVGGSLARVDVAGWTEVPVDLDTQGIVDFPDEAARAPLEGSSGRPTVEGLRVDRRGVVWVALAVPEVSSAPMMLLRLDGETWSVVDPLGAGRYFNVDLLDVSPDGTLWVYLETGTGSGSARPYLARFADDRWTVFSREDGVPRLVWRGESSGLLRAGHDGTVWVVPQEASQETCPGIRSFDGSTWRGYLDGSCALDLEVAPDGSVWVATGSDDPREERDVRHEVFRIDPSVPVQNP